MRKESVDEYVNGWLLGRYRDGWPDDDVKCWVHGMIDWYGDR